MELTFVTAFCAFFVIRNSIALEDSIPCPDCKCDIKCNTIQELGERVTVLERSMTAADEKESDAMDQQHQIQSTRIQALDQKIRKMEVRLRKLESENSSKTPMLEISGLRIDDTKDNGEKRAGINETLEDILQNLSSVNQKVDEIESRKKIEDLTVIINEMQQKLEEEEQISRSLQTRLDETIDFIKGPDSLSTEREKMIISLSILSDNIDDLDIKHNKSAEVLKQEISSVESKLKHFVSSIKTLYEVQDIFNLTLSLNQRDADGLKEEISNINVTLSSFLQKFGITGNELQNLSNSTQQESYGNIAATTTFSATPVQSDRSYGPYSFTEYEKHREAEAYDNERQGHNCFLPSYRIRYLKIARITKTGLLPLRKAYGPGDLISSGTKLRFGCSVVGETIAMERENYEQIKSNFTLQCVNGQWKGGEFPACHLAQEGREDKINEFSGQLYMQDKNADRCNFSKENVADDLDCAGYYLCVDGKVKRFECQNSLVFNMASGFCEPPSNVDCQARRHAYGNRTNSAEKIGNVYNHTNIYYKKAQMERLSSLLPRIRVQYDILDKRNSLLATGPIGEIVAYPQSTVTLHCMFPLRINSSEDLIWVAKYFNSSHHRPPWNIRTKWYKRSLRLDSLTENDSGIYSCIGPNGRQNEIQLIVRAITCPPFVIGSTNKIEITYKPHPRIKSLAMTTQAFFKCPDGYDKLKVKKAICTVYGHWSEEMHMGPLPRLDLCRKSRTSGKEQENLEGQSDGCLPYDKILNRGVIIDSSTNKTRYDIGDSIRFQCKDSQFLIGSNSLSCETGGHWSSATPPRCVSL